MYCDQQHVQIVKDAVDQFLPARREAFDDRRPHHGAVLEKEKRQNRNQDDGQQRADSGDDLRSQS